MPLKGLDRVWAQAAQRGLAAKQKKQINLFSDGVTLEIALRGGTHLLSKPERLQDLLLGLGVMDLVRMRVASPKEVASVGGVLQWNNLLSRPLFSCLRHYYHFVEDCHDNTQRQVNVAVLSELPLICLYLCSGRLMCKDLGLSGCGRRMQVHPSAMALAGLSAAMLGPER